MANSNDFKKKRINYYNNFNIHNYDIEFPAEQNFLNKLKEKNITQILEIVTINENCKYTDKQNTYIAYFIEALDCLPIRPDNAFDLMWKILDSIISELKENYRNNRNGSEYKEAGIKLIFSTIKDSKISLLYENFIRLISNAIPLQTCEFIVKRIFEYGNSDRANESRTPEKTFNDRLKKYTNNKFQNELIKKYNSVNTPESHRNASILMQKMLKGSEVDLNGEKFNIKNEDLENFFSLIICAQYRNERAHGLSSPPFRRSTAKIKTFSHPYILTIFTYYTIVSLLYSQNENMFNINDIESQMQKTVSNFKLIFKN